eukprot:CAMPEP_0174929440 /NCGR_PEP_ID=MMETSP1355-20121228/27204_1 /TAXON_ID=464990 /ORGANISM="Hemiselmis tepida, Strain CCMP443" /LENGTH=44 /DNA_ID= /DNA_START= /DNA_END= /DNA_ORIENTATION=
MAPMSLEGVSVGIQESSLLMPRRLSGSTALCARARSCGLVLKRR